jgi:hypothetical protein
MKNVSQRAFYHRFKDNGRLFHRGRRRTRPNRWPRAQQDGTGCRQADVTVLGVADSCGIALGHPVRAARLMDATDRKDKSNHRWIRGGKLCVVLNKLSLVTDWDCDIANVHDGTLQPLLALSHWRAVLNPTCIGA